MIRFFRRSILSKWLVSYLLLLMIPFLCTFVSFNYSRRTVRTGIQQTNQMALSSLLSNIDHQFEQMIYSAESLLVSDPIRQAENAQNDTARFLATMPKLIETINNYQQPSGQFDILVYLPTQDYLVTSTTANTRERLIAAQQYAHGNSISDQTFAIVHAPDYAGRFLISTEYSYLHYGEPHIVYLRSLRNGARSNQPRHYATILVNLPVDRLTDLFSAVQDQIVLIHDESGELLYQSSPIPEGDALDIVSHDGALSYRVGKTHYVGYQMRSAVSGWTVSLISPENLFWRSEHYVTTVFLITLGISLLIGLFMTAVLLHRNYKPVHMMMRSIDPNASVTEQDEWHTIQQLVLALKNERSDMRTKVAKHRDLLLRMYLRSHLRGTDKQLPEEDVHSFLQVDFSSLSFAIISFAVNDELFMQHSTAQSTPNEASICLSDMLLNLFAQQFESGPPSYPLFHDQFYTWLVILPNREKDAFAEQAAHRIESILAELKNLSDVPVLALMSDILDDFDMLPGAYAKMQDTYTYQYVMGSQGIVHVSCDEPLSDPLLLEDKQIELICDAICAQRPDDACAVIERMAEHLPTEATEDSWQSRLRIYGWISAVLNHGEVWAHATRADVLKPLNTLYGTADEKKLLHLFTAIVHALCAQCEPVRNEGGSLSQKVRSYIDQHYANPELCLAMLGENLGLNPKYLSSVYGAETGQSPIEYISQVRVHHARLILEQQMLPIATVAEMVGYTSIQTFRRAFVRYEGVTPSKIKRKE